MLLKNHLLLLLIHIIILHDWPVIYFTFSLYSNVTLVVILIYVTTGKIPSILYMFYLDITSSLFNKVVESFLLLLSNIISI
ncbi:hypothetical protein BDF19DRAFT_234912 [Syncephalis fuscata]|nr:hypothetical protein BDF19DRAFT_234912 [Syncephalis fuscata]